MRREVRGVVRSMVLASVWLAGCAGTVKAPYPKLQADTSPAAIARGAAIFHASCESCHRGGDNETASGAPLHELPSYMGKFHASNLTSHPTAGIGSATDEELARVIRYAVSRDGRLMVMPSYGMGDKDLAAVLGFLRSGHPLFTPDPTPAPRSEFSFIGGLGFRIITGNEPIPRPPLGIPVPEKAATLEYGRYMAHDVYDCASCHTPGFSPRKTEGDEVFSGGMSFKDPEGQDVESSNITFHGTGLAHWTLEDFTRAVKDGIAPDGSALRSPMPRFRGMDAVEAQALYDYLRSVPPKKNHVDGARPRLTANSVRPTWVTKLDGAEREDGSESTTVAEAASATTTGTGAASPASTAGAVAGTTPRSPQPHDSEATAPHASADHNAANAPAHGSATTVASKTAGGTMPQGSATTVAGSATHGSATTVASKTAGGTTPHGSATTVAGSATHGSAATAASNTAGGATPHGSATTVTSNTAAGTTSPATIPVASSPAPRKPRPAAPKVDAPKLFTQLGCAGCHAPGARYHEQLARASRRSDTELVRWVRNPEQFQPGTPMPTYADLLDERTALALVRWVKSGGPATLAPVAH
ncbi:c-type cytochrome [Myxococcus sp. AB025B]|uniref:c-type cytochrome n=1 Tax=Myxococcus sp. AB025B TaxID=2562794 RepID=UPI00114205A0|nr:c-type cytochrome [Myxococcus sp. AB025B]